MRSEDLMRMIMVGFLAAALIFSLAGCGNTVKGFETDIYEKRKAVSDFVNPVETPVKEEKIVD
tara:strand:+ start:1556 stop:1744 length:189 start_codon:yes stop_codon:yes gene_type:complete